MPSKLTLVFALAAVIVALPGTAPDRATPSGNSAYASVSPVISSAGVPSTRLVAFPRGPVIGIADNRVETFADTRFLATGIKRARVTIPYDMVKRGGGLRKYYDWYFDTLRAGGFEPLVSWYRTYGCNRFCAAKRLPSVKAFRGHFRRFRRRYPHIKLFSTWNEINYAAPQPTGRNPKRAGQYYKMLRRECRGRRCTVLTGDFRADGGRKSAKWLKAFKKEIGRGSHRWGLVAHPDVTARQSKRTRAFLRATRGPVWVTEVGPVYRFGRKYRPSIARQSSSARYLLRKFPRISRRIQRMYFYHWRASPTNKSWDSAFLDAAGNPRPAYNELFSALGVSLPY